ncbi:MAG: TolC family protein [Pseudomonadota bacterium]
MKNKKIIFLLVLISFPLSAAKLSLSEYLEQVSGGNQNYTASQKSFEAGRNKSEEGDLMLAYSFFTNAQYSNDKRESNFSFVTGDRTTSGSLDFGFKKVTSFGFSGSLYYSVDYAYMHGANTTFLSSNTYYATSPVLEFRQSLWQNAFGRQTRAIVEATDAKNTSSSYAASYVSKQILSGAEVLYWKLSVTRDLVKILEDNLERAEKLSQWSKKRASLNLADDVDYLQSEANVKMAQLELQAAVDEEKETVREFNTMRGLNSDDLKDDLEKVTVDSVIRSDPPARKGVREDVLSLKEYARAAAANAKLSRDKNAPTMDLFSTLSLNGRDPKFDTSFKESWRGNYPYAVVGIQFNAPLDFRNIHRVNSGYELDKLSAQDSYERKSFEVDREWDSMNKKLNELKGRLKIAKEAEDAQHKKYTHEQKRHKLGRTTTYQVILFEKDYAMSQYLRLQLQSQILQLIATMKTFQGQEG